MRKTIILLFSAAGLLSCTKELAGTQEPAAGVPMNFEISVEETKASKTGWADGDKIYVFFNGLETKYLIMTYSSESGSWSDTSGGGDLLDTDFSGLGTRTLTAVHFPVAVDVNYSDGRFSFASGGKPVYNFYLYESGKAYTVDGATVTATMSMGKPADMVQIHVAGIESSVADYTFGCSKIRPVACKSVGIDGTITENVLHAGALLSGIADSDGGIFAGRLTDPDVKTDYTFTVTDNSNIYTLTRSNRALTAGKMYNFPALSETGGANWSVSAKDSEYTDLSAAEAANTYIVSSAGKYKFNATIKGNGGLDPLTGTTATTIDPADISGVKVLWELYNDVKKGISPAYHTIKYDSGYDISYSDGYVTFSTPDTFKEGVACVAVYDSSDNILWSWLIWATTEPGTKTYNGRTFMNKNLGATSRNGYSDNYVRGFLYQWGRKDAFSAASGSIDDVYWFTPVAADVFTGVTTVESMAYTVARPTTRIACWTSSTHSWMPEEEYSKRPWREEVKTIYDPCPPGWKVPAKDDMDGISGLPATGLYSSDGPGLKNFGNAGTGYYWTSTISDDPTLPGNAYAFCNDGRNIQNWSQAEGYAIRPVRE
ncbi:MAG: hypothetical protein IJU34_07120 [Bacteroidales bacterium]|nr:hypothetical protein [Bacteroidales bacterium]